MIKMSRSFKIPETLVECFQFYTTVSSIEGDESLWKVVIQQQIQLYINGYSSNRYLGKAVDTAGGLLYSLLAIEDQGKYMGYNKGGGNPQEIAASLAVTFPKVLSTLLYLHFQLSDDYSELGGGTWNDNEERNNTLNCPLVNWLTDKGKLSKDLMGRGLKDDNFKDDSITCTKILEEVKKLIKKKEECDFLEAQQGLFFIAPLWHDSHLGNVILFLKVFCDDVSNDEVKSHFNAYYSYVEYERLKDICTNVMDNIDALTLPLCPLYEKGETMYQEQLKHENVYRYLLWLDDNLSHIIRSLKSMKADSWFWASENLKNAESSGPFKYGFQFKNKKWDAAMQNRIQIAITALTSASSSDLCQESLHDLAQLITYLHTPKIQGKGVVTGLFSMAGVMTAATYAVNIMGTIDAIRSLIQFPNTVKKMVSGLYDHVKAYLTV